MKKILDFAGFKEEDFTISKTRSNVDLRASQNDFLPNRFEKLMVQKLAYEWKNIYRVLS